MSRTRVPLNVGGGPNVQPELQNSDAEAGDTTLMSYLKKINRQQGGSVARAVPVQRRAVSRKRASVVQPSNDAASCPRCDRGPNWMQHEMPALIDAKRDEYMKELDCADARDLMEPDTTKWERISDKVMAAGYSPCLRDYQMCKGKWNLLILEYCRITDYHARTGTNREVFWTLTTQQHVQQGLPKSFPREFYARIDEWFGQWPQIQPSHVRDLLSPKDANYIQVKDSLEDDMDAPCDDEEAQHGDPNTYSISTPSHEQLQRPAPFGCGKDMSPSAGSSHGLPHASPAVQSPRPPGLTVMPSQQVRIVLSSSESAGTSSKKRIGSTGIHRRSLPAQVAIVEATKSAGDVMVAQMKEMVGVTRETENNKLEVQLRLFLENMNYQGDKDRRLYEQGLIVAENARLAILKQGELVAYLTNISKVLSQGLKVSQTEDLQTRTGLVPCLEQEVNKQVGKEQLEGTASTAARGTEQEQ